MSAEDFIWLLDGVRRSGTGWRALCPAHDDSSPSLSVTEADDRLLVYCHAGCSVDEIIDVLGLELRDLYFHADDGET
jgi:DNA primase